MKSVKSQELQADTSETSEVSEVSGIRGGVYYAITLTRAEGGDPCRADPRSGDAAKEGELQQQVLKDR